MNYFLRCGTHPLREWLEEGNVKLHFTFQTRYECQYVTDLVGESWRQWRSDCPVFISAQTGTGKNTFVENKILREVLSHNRHYASQKTVAIIQNRTTLKRQTLERIAKVVTRYTGDMQAQESLNDFTESGINKYVRRIGPIYILTYQFLATPEGVKLLHSKPFDYVVLDEAHFFTCDALFNADTETILRSIVRFCRSSVRIYMSATIESAFEPIARAEFDEWEHRWQPIHTAHDAIAPFMPQEAWTFNRCFASLQRSCEKLHLQYYDLERKFEHLDKLNSICPNALPDEIEKREGHWMVFVANKQDGQTMRKALEDKGISAVFLSSESKDSAAFRELVKAETIEAAEVIIATAVIDNGVNVRDERITDIAIMVFDRTELIQMLGRLRVNPQTSQSVRLWIPEWNDDELMQLLLSNVRKLVDCLLLEGLERDAKDALIETYLRYKTGFRINAEQGLYYSHCVLYPLIEAIQCITGILRNRTPEFHVDLDEDTPYYALALKIFYTATNGKLPLSDAVSRALLGLNLLEDRKFLEAQIGWKRTTEADDSFLMYVYALRIKDLQKTIQGRALRLEGNVPAPEITDNHIRMTDEDLKKTLRRQQKLQQRFGKSMSAWQEVHFWLELDPPREQPHPPKISSFENLADVLKKNSITEEELHAARSENNKCSDKKFLATFGLPKKASTELEKGATGLAQAFFALKHHYLEMTDEAELSMTKLMNHTKKQAFVLENFAYRLESLLSSSNETFYVILRTPIKPS